MMRVDEKNDVPIFSGKMVDWNPLAAGVLSEDLEVQEGPD
jgi:hypothetical protein